MWTLQIKQLYKVKESRSAFSKYRKSDDGY